MKTGRRAANRPGFVPRGRPALGFALLAGLLGPSCKGNVNDDSVNVIDLRFMSVSTGGAPADNGASDPRISDDGRFVVFSSQSTNLHPLDQSSIEDIFLRDTVNNVTRLVSVNTTGTGGGNEFSFGPVVSPDGRFVAWTSRASDLALGFTDNNNNYDVYVRDMAAGVTVPVSVDIAETAPAGVDGFDSRSISITSDATDVYVAFQNFNDNVVAGVTGFRRQIYLRKIPVATFSTISSGTSVLVSRNTAGTDGANSYSSSPALGQDATNVYVAWDSQATNLHALDASGTEDIFWRPVNKGTLALSPTVLVSINNAGTAGGSAPVGGNSRLPDISADGRFVVFQSEADNLLAVNIDTNNAIDIYVRGDLVSGPVSTTRVSVNSGGGQAVGNSQRAAIAPGGQLVVFESVATNLVPGDTNGSSDIFLHDRGSGATTRVSLTLFGGQASSETSEPDISGTQEVVFRGPGNLIPGPLTFEGAIFKRGM